MTNALGRKSVTIRAEKKAIGWEVTKLIRDKKLSYRQILLHTGVDRNQVKQIEEARGYMIDTYLKVIKYLRHGEGMFKINEITQGSTPE